MGSPNYKINQDYRMKTGWVFTVYKGSKRIAHISLKKFEVAKGLKAEDLAEVLAIKNNFDLLVALNSIKDIQMDRILLRLPKSLTDALSKAYSTAKTNKKVFDPAVAMVKALEREIVQVLPEYKAMLI